MSQTRYYFRVGVALAVALALLGVGIAFLRGTITDFRTIGFDVEFLDARSITKGAPVEMAGVQIGRVEEVRLTPQDRARLRLRVDRRYPIPRGARFAIASSLLGGAATLKIDPAASPGGAAIAENEPNVRGEDTPSPETAIAQSTKLLGSLQRTASALEKIAADPRTRRDLQETLRNARVATEDLPALSRNIRTQLSLLSTQANHLLKATAANGDAVARSATHLTSDLRTTVAENRGSIHSLIENTDATASAFRGLAEQLNTTLKGGKLQQNLAVTTDNLRSTTSRLDSIAGNIERLSSDPRLSGDIRDTVTNLKETSASVRSLAARIETIHLPGERRGGPGRPPLPPREASLLEPGPVLDTAYDTKARRLRVDLDFTFLGTSGRFYRAGISDFSESNRLNLQLGRILAAPGKTALRYGLLSGKIGGGLDVRGGPVDLRFDLLNPNRPTLNIRAKARLSDTASALFGMDSVGNANQTMVGMQIRH